MIAYRLLNAQTQPEFQEVPEPHAGPGQVVVKVAGSGLCHTDFTVISRDRAYWKDDPPPFTLGHEIAGWVEEIGSGVRSSSQGTPWRSTHVDVTRIRENREAAAKLDGDASIGLVLRHLSASRLVTIAQIEGRVRGVGSEFVLACDMRFAARESAIFGQFEPAFGVIPGAGAAQHLTRLMGRGRALEVLLSADDYDAELAERYGWINRALPADELGDFLRSLVLRIASFPAAGHAVVKNLVNEIALASAEDIRRDSDLFLEGVSAPEYQRRMQAAMKRGFQTRDAEMNLGQLVADL